MKYSSDFVCPKGTYLQSHSVGLMLKSHQDVISKAYLSPWQKGSPWSYWLEGLEHFCRTISKLLNTESHLICPQTNVSSGLSKLLRSRAEWRDEPCTLLMSEDDFPSMGYVIKHCLPNATIRFLPKHAKVSEFSTWQLYLSPDIDIVFISHVYSNLGCQAPLEVLIAAAHRYNAKVIVDCAQSVGIIPIDLHHLNADFVIGSCIKWLCGGPGAGFLWINQRHLATCEPQDVGWFSHQDPFEFDIHAFKMHTSAWRFLGGTPSIVPFLIASNSCDYILALGVDAIRQHNWHLLSQLHRSLFHRIVSPLEPTVGSGTAILNIKGHEAQFQQLARQENIFFDVREYGIRISPHIYNGLEEIEHLIALVKRIE